MSHFFSRSSKAQKDWKSDVGKPSLSVADYNSDRYALAAGAMPTALRGHVKSALSMAIPSNGHGTPSSSVYDRDY
jgi:hypothetical protein